MAPFHPVMTSENGDVFSPFTWARMRGHVASQEHIALAVEKQDDQPPAATLYPTTPPSPPPSSPRRVNKEACTSA